jgi:hypothetical protein
VRRSLLLIAGSFGLAAAVALSSQSFAKDQAAKSKATKPVTKPSESSCGNYGTRVDFVGTPSEAARRAKKEEKLVFVLHVSGHFEDPRFT